MQTARGACLLVASAVTVAVHAQFGGPGEFPSFRNMSALPGSGFGVTPGGLAGFRGAMGYSTPVAYSLAPWEVVVGMTIVSHDWKLAFQDTSGGDSKTGNGSVQLQFGLPVGKFGALSYGVLVKSSHGDNSGTIQWTPPGQAGPVRFALGVQDWRGRGGSAGFGLPEDRDWARSVYVVGTWQALDDTYVSVGYGDQHRYRGAFGNASHAITPRLKAVGEYDTFNWNWILAYDLGKVAGPVLKDRRPVQVVAFVGQEAGKFGLWGFNIRF